jgi:hypothetical protein
VGDGDGPAVGLGVALGVGVRVGVRVGVGVGAEVPPSHPAMRAMRTQKALATRILPAEMLPRCPPSVSVV